MKRFWAARVLLLLLSLAPAASVAVAQGVATDNELFAAYCFGQLQERKLIGEPWAQSTDAVKTNGMERTRRYLNSKGYWPGGGRGVNAMEAIAAATQYGRGDAAACEKERAWLESVQAACRRECAEAYSKECAACYARGAPPACVRGWRCNDLSSLPL